MIQRKSKQTSTLMTSAIILTFVAGNNLTMINALANGSNITQVGTLKQISNLSEAKGWLENASIEWEAISKATGYNVYYKSTEKENDQFKQLDSNLIRQYSDHFRADILGLKEGKYILKVVPIINGKEDTSKQIICEEVEVKAHTREGFAFSQDSLMKTGSGGYNDDGTVPENAQIIYVTKDNINDVKLDVITNSKGTKTSTTGLVNILNARAKGYDKTPLIIRLIGQIKDTDIEGLNSNGYLQVKGVYNTTIEGVGKDATVYGWGFLIRGSYNIELRNVGIMLFKDDAISLDTGNENIWIHNNDIFYGAAGSDSDQVKGDGSADVKGKSTYVTISNNHFWDSGKASLCGMSDTEEFFVTYHHNWFDHSDSRHPRIRVGSVHIYNNYFDGNSKYGVGITKGGSAFVEANDFRNAKYPMLISLQGSDIAGNSKGTFSGEAGGIIKAYNNKISGATRLVYHTENSTQFDAYLSKTRNEKVPSSIKSVSGGNTYNNFDTSDKMYEYTPDNPEDVREIVTTYAGRVEGGDFDWTFTNSDDTDYKVNEALMKKIVSYKTDLISVGGGSIITPSSPDTNNTTKPSSPDTNNTTKPSSPDTNDTTLSSEVTHNFTKSGLNSNIFNISGNLSSNKGTVNYNGLKLTTALKMESSASIKFNTSNNSTLTLVFNSDFNKKVKIDGKEYTAKNGVVTVNLSAGSHTITKGGSANLFYIKLATTGNNVNDSNNQISKPVVSSGVHNFTKSGLNSNIFNISGNLSSNKGTVNYNGLKLTTALKMESSTSIKFNTSNNSTLTLVFNSDFNKKVKIDGKEYTAKNGVVTVNLSAGSHTITKGGSANLFYIKLD